MALLPGTGKMIQVSIDSHRDQKMQDMEFSLEFYVHANRRKAVSKNDLIRIDRTDGTSMFFVMLDTRTLGSGTLMCNIRITDPEARWNGGRPVFIRRNTGCGVGGAADSPSHSIQKDWEEGYKIDFNTVWAIPKPEVAYIFYGKFVDQINSFDELTPEMLVSPENKIISVSAGKMGKTPISDIVAGNKVLVLIPSDYGYVATKDNGIGGKVPFDTSIMGCNGEKQITVDGSTYNIYGEFMTVSGELFIYVD